MNYHDSKYLIFKDIISSSSGLNVSKEVVIPNVSDNYIDIKLYNKNIGITTTSYSGSDPDFGFGTDLTHLMIEKNEWKVLHIMSFSLTQNAVKYHTFEILVLVEETLWKTSGVSLKVYLKMARCSIKYLMML